MTRRPKSIIIILLLLFACLGASPAAKADIITSLADLLAPAPATEEADTIPVVTLSPLEAADTLVIIPSRHFTTYSAGYLSPLIFDTYHLRQTPDIRPATLSSTPAPDLGPSADWLRDMAASMALTDWARMQYIIEQPSDVPFLLDAMSQPPMRLQTTIEPKTNRIIMRDIPIEAPRPTEELGISFNEKRWLHNFNASLQFSQAYLSPNWYQGGNNNLNAIAQIYWNVKLNEKFYPKLLFEMTTQYKLGVNSAPDDTVRSYNISDDLFQFNANFGYKAAHNWYYSANVLFKTQIFNNYASNSHNLRAALLSPGELNVGLGMTYSKTTKRVTFGASINPLSYNLKTCINDRMNETAYGIKEGHTTVSQYGSNAELNFKAKISWNISYSSRLFLFTNYEYLQGDWQNTLAFDINRFLATQIFWNIRYDTSTNRIPDSRWHRFQIKEIFSFGLSYKFSTV